MSVLNKTETRVMDALGVTIEAMQTSKFDAIASKLPMAQLDALNIVGLKPLENLAKAHAKLNRTANNGYVSNKFHFVRGKSKIGIYGIKQDGSVAKYADWITRQVFEALVEGKCDIPQIASMDEYVSKRQD